MCRPACAVAGALPTSPALTKHRDTHVCEAAGRRRFNTQPGHILSADGLLCSSHPSSQQVGMQKKISSWMGKGHCSLSQTVLLGMTGYGEFPTRSEEGEAVVQRIKTDVILSQSQACKPLLLCYPMPLGEDASGGATGAACLVGSGKYAAAGMVTAESEETVPAAAAEVAAAAAAVFAVAGSAATDLGIAVTEVAAAEVAAALPGTRAQGNHHACMGEAIGKIKNQADDALAEDGRCSDDSDQGSENEGGCCIHRQHKQPLHSQTTDGIPPCLPGAASTDKSRSSSGPVPGSRSGSGSQHPMHAPTAVRRLQLQVRACTW